MRGRELILPLGVAALTHAGVDAACAVLLFGGVAAARITPAGILPAFLGYGLLAFGTQPVIGFAADRTGSYRPIAVAGALAAVVAPLVALVSGGIVPAVVIAGLGNAAFHVGAGAFSLKVTPGRALAPGLFVAPGAAGLAIGTVAGRAGASPWPIVGVLAVLTALLAITLRASAARAAFAPHRGPRATNRPIPGLEYLLLLVLVVVTVRSFVGTAVAFPWRTEPWMLIAITLAVVAGKALGGVLADRFGRVAAGASTLLVAAPLLVLGATSPILGIAGLLAFNVTMPITLVAIADVMPEHPGSAFGLTCVALIAGAFPALIGLPVATLSPSVLFAIVAASAAVLAVALLRLGSHSVPRVARDVASEGIAL